MWVCVKYLTHTSNKTGCVQEAKPSTGLHELSLLAKLIKPPSKRNSKFKLNLFGDKSAQEQNSPGELLSVWFAVF